MHPSIYGPMHKIIICEIICLNETSGNCGAACFVETDLFRLSVKLRENKRQFKSAKDYFDL
jgi:hypothetical protein